jgi:hypothetical protein
MAELTISIPDELAQRLEPLQDRLPELLTQLVEALSPPTISADVLSLPAQPMDAPLAYAEVLEFLLNRPTHEAIVAFKVLPVAQARIRALLDWRIIRIHYYDKGFRICIIMEMPNDSRKDNTNR